MTTDRYIRLPVVISMTSLSESSIRRREREGAFPKRVRLGPAAVAWRESEIVRWIAAPGEWNAQP